MSDAVEEYLKDAPVQVLDRIATQQLTLTTKIKHVEKRIQGITDEFTDLIDLITHWQAWAYSIEGSLLDREELTVSLMPKTDAILRKMREKYG
ncbi:MAG: hypothetical protein ACXABY_13085 [Candidatus Thorarchaeota archaeon]|jgi:hypothetical protein